MNRKFLLINIFLITIIIVIMIFIRNYNGNVVAPSSVFIESLNIVDNKMKLVVLNSSSACVIKKCEVERLGDEINIFVYETAWVPKDITTLAYHLDIDFDPNVNEVYIKGNRKHTKKLIWSQN